MNKQESDILNILLLEPFVNQRILSEVSGHSLGVVDMNLQVDHIFDIFGQIDFYESLWDGAPSMYRDYQKTKEHVLSLKDYIEKHRAQWCLTHIDAVPDNFLFNDGGLQLTDWEYSGMQDPHVDIAMFCIYLLYDRPQTDHLIDLYFNGSCNQSTRLKIAISILVYKPIEKICNLLIRS